MCFWEGRGREAPTWVDFLVSPRVGQETPVPFPPCIRPGAVVVSAASLGQRCSGVHLSPPPGWGPPSALGDRRAVRSIGTAQTLQLICSKTLFFQLANGGDNTHLLGCLKGETRPYM